MKIKKLNRTVLDRRVRIFYVLSVLLFVFSFLVLQPANEKQRSENGLLQQEIIRLDNDNTTLRK